MITVIVEEYNQFSQDFYDSIVNSLQLHRIRCSCNHCGCMKIHGYYMRDVHTSDGTYPLRIQRLICSECGRTHAILLSSIVPYDRLSLEGQRLIVNAFEDGTDTSAVCTPQGSVDENNVKSVILRYRRHWRERLRAEGIPLSDVPGLVSRCFACFSRQFMQIRRSVNILYPSTT